ncbi:unnamed protein product [Eretmochelys imbricata]
MLPVYPGLFPCTETKTHLPMKAGVSKRMGSCDGCRTLNKELTGCAGGTGSGFVTLLLPTSAFSLPLFLSVGHEADPSAAATPLCVPLSQVPQSAHRTPKVPNSGQAGE